MIRGLLDEKDTDLLRQAIADYTVGSVAQVLGPRGEAALQRGDLCGATREVSGDGQVQTLIRLFLLGEDVPEAAARAAFGSLPLESATAAGLIAASAGSVKALLDLRPYTQAGNDESPGADWWVVSDQGAELRGAPLAADHVLGIGAASLTLAQATPRLPGGTAVDIGTGCGIQALHLGAHADSVIATDVSARALRLAATTAALSGQSWDLRAGSLLDPVAGDQFDLVVSNPPFVVSDGGGGYDYRDSGMAGDAVCAALVERLPSVLAAGGTAQLLANWIIPTEVPWQDRVAGWLTGRGCDAWVWQREVADPAEYVALWLRDAGEQPGSARWRSRYQAWLDWFAAAGVAAIGMGMITLWQGGTCDPVLVIEDVPQALEQPIGAHLPEWHARQRWLAARGDAALLAARLGPVAGLVRDRAELLGVDGWTEARTTLRQSYGMRWELETDDAISALVAGCASGEPLLTPVRLLAEALRRSTDEVAAAVLPVVRDLVGRGFLVPADLPPSRVTR